MAYDSDEPILSTHALVNERWRISSDIIGPRGESIYDMVLEELAKILPTLEDKLANMPTLDGISWPTYNVAIDTDIESERPVRPSNDELRIRDMYLPQMRHPLVDIYMPEILALPSTSELPTIGDLNFYWGEQEYTSLLRDAISASLLSWIQNGGTGLGDTVLTAIWDGHLNRLQDEHERKYNEITNLFSSLGWTQPPLAMNAMMSYLNSERTRSLTDRDNEITIEEARLAQNNTQFAHTTGVEWEKALMGKHDAVMNRSYEVAKDTMRIPMEIFAMRVQLYTARVDATRSSADAAKATVEAQASVNRDIAMIYEADIKAYEAQMNAEIRRVTAIAEVFASMMRGHESEAAVAEVKLKAELEKYRALIEQAKNGAQLSIEEARLLLANWLSVTELATNTQSEITKIGAQIAASALGSISASASLGYSFNRSDHTSRTDPIEQTHISEIHQYNETPE